MSCVLFEYGYRDASNYKQAGSVRFQGKLDFADVQRLEKALDPMNGFVPSAVGIDHLEISGSGRTEDDHPYHDVQRISTNASFFDDSRTFSQFVDECEKVNWDEAGEKWSRETPICDRDETEFE